MVLQDAPTKIILQTAAFLSYQLIILPAKTRAQVVLTQRISILNQLLFNILLRYKRAALP